MTVITQAVRPISAVNALGIDARDALARGEIDAPIYLLDQAGAGFGYRYEWERYGPFSEALAAELVELTDEDLQDADTKTDEAIDKAVDRLRPLIEPVSGVTQMTWIRLVASLDFLRRFAGMQLKTRPRPVYIEANFEQPVIDAAIERLQGFTS